MLKTTKKNKLKITKITKNQVHTTYCGDFNMDAFFLGLDLC